MEVTLNYVLIIDEICMEREDKMNHVGENPRKDQIPWPNPRLGLLDMAGPYKCGLGLSIPWCHAEL